MQSTNVKKTIACTLFSVLLVFSSSGFCQGDESSQRRSAVSSLGFSVGINNFNQRDKYLSPYVFRGTMFVSSLSYRMVSGREMQKIEAFFSLGGLNSDVQPRDVFQDIGRLSYSYVHALGRWDILNSPLVLYLGGGVSSLAMNTDFTTVDNVAGSTLYDESWYWHHSLDLVVVGGYLFGGERRIDVKFTSPAVGLVSRPKNGHWLNTDNSDVIRNFGNAAVQGRFEPFWKAPVVFTEIEYSQLLGDHLRFRATYSFAYVASDRPAEILSMGMYSNNVLAGVEWVF